MFHVKQCEMFHVKQCEMFHVKPFSPVFFLPYPCRGLTGWGGGWRQEKGGRLAAGKGGGGWRLLTGRRLIAHRAAVDSSQGGD